MGSAVAGSAQVCLDLLIFTEHCAAFVLLQHVSL